MAQLLTLLAQTKQWGAPSFAQFAKGGNHELMRNGVYAEGQKCRQHRYPPLQKTQGRGTLSIDAPTTSSKGGPPAGMCLAQEPTGAALRNSAFSSQAMLDHTLEEELLHILQYPASKTIGVATDPALGITTIEAQEAAADVARKFPDPTNLQ
ncbi:MAG: hypothetical protein LAO24_20435 [Acidobacteriia bacterium]|nr:hypothetical protein [Terriglobia bacterium]